MVREGLVVEGGHLPVAGRAVEGDRAHIASLEIIGAHHLAAGTRIAEELDRNPEALAKILSAWIEKAEAPGRKALQHPAGHQLLGPVLELLELAAVEGIGRFRGLAQRRGPADGVGDGNP